MNRLFALLFALLLLPGDAFAAVAAVPVGASGCVACHGDIRLDAAHNLACTACHSGQGGEQEQQAAHAGLIVRPAHPDSMAQTCGSCHQAQVERAKGAGHFTLANKINAVRAHFGATKRLAGPNAIPVADPASSPQALADDLLRRRCLRCHVYGPGDHYPAVSHGSGCAACHLPFQNGRLQAHTFARPADNRCLSCHYGNYVGSDYHGRSEHDYHWEYRTPYAPTGYGPRPYGLEYRDLTPDIHQQRGLVCIDCHQDSGHNAKPSVRCASCHDWRPGQPVPPVRTLKADGGLLVLTSRADGRIHPVPPLQHPAHREFGRTVACQVCHAQWGSNDSTTHLLLTHTEDFDPWEELTVQGSSEVESLLSHNLYSDDPERPAAMRDGLTGEVRPGVWLQGFTQRRFEQLLVRRDTDGVIKVFRPILDLRLSLVDADDNPLVDNLTGADNGLRPYTPHTTGPAGLFYRDRFQHLLER